MYLPAFPRIAKDFDTAIAAVQITLAIACFWLGRTGDTVPGPQKNGEQPTQRNGD
jgi:hypothetical protein